MRHEVSFVSLGEARPLENWSNVSRSDGPLRRVLGDFDHRLELAQSLEASPEIMACQLWHGSLATRRIGGNGDHAESHQESSNSPLVVRKLLFNSLFEFLAIGFKSLEKFFQFDDGSGGNSPFSGHVIVLL